MKKFLAIILALAMVFAFAACGETKTEPQPADTNPGSTEPAPAPETSAKVYTYEEDKGNYTVTWTLSLNDDGSFTLDELNGRLDVTTTHTGKSYTVDGDRITAGAWDDPTGIPEFAEADGTILWDISGDKITPFVDMSGISPLVGTYVYEEDKGDFKIVWTLTLNKDYTYALNELHGMSGNETLHTGSEWEEAENNVVKCGPWDAEENVSEFMAPNGACDWIIMKDDGAMRPANEENGGEAAGLTPGKYTFLDETPRGTTKFEVLVMGNGNCRIDVTDGDAAPVEHNVDGFTDLGNGYFETGALLDGEPAFEPPFFAPNGACVWHITDADAMTIEHSTMEEAKGASGEAAGAAALTPGKYTFLDETPRGTTKFEVLVMGNGNCRIDVTDGDAAPVEHNVDGFTDLGNGYFETGALLDGEPAFEPPFFAPNGACVWHITDAEAMTIEHSTMEEAKGASGEAAGAAEVEPGKYSFEIDGEKYAVLIMGNGGCKIQLLGADGETAAEEYTCKGWKSESGTEFKTFAFEDGSAVPAFVQGDAQIINWVVTGAGVAEIASFQA